MRCAWLFALLLWGCSKGPQADLPLIAQARSLGAEWALVNEQAAQGKLTATYSSSMRKQLRNELEATAKSLKQTNSSYAKDVQALLHQPDYASPQVLRGCAARLKRQESQLESA